MWVRVPPGQPMNTMNINEEIELIIKVITHPAGFIVDMFGGALSIHGTEDPDCWEVSWEVDESFCTWKSFATAQEAAQFFCEQRRKREIGMDIEAELILRQKNDFLG